MLVLEKSGLWIAVALLRRFGSHYQKAIILGGGPLAKNIYSALLRSPKLGIQPVAIVDEEAAMNGKEIHASSYGQRESALILAGPLSARLFHNMNASTLIIADPSLDNAEIIDIMVRAAMVDVSTYIVSRDYLEPGYWLEYSEIDGMMLASLTSETERHVSDLAKRAVDVVLALAALLLLALPCAVAALLIRLTSPGPAMFRQLRVGHRGQLFFLYKFRSMYANSEAYAFSPRSGLDSRITPIGRFLRRTCFDEIPQLLNVLRGEMSLVGPRPEMPFIVDRYTGLQRKRLSVKPGITGLWQLSGDRGRLIHENLEYDLYYIDDCIDGLLRLMASQYREPLNLGTDELISVDGLVDLVCEIADKRLVKYHDLTKPQGVRGRNSDNSRLREVLGWEPQIRLCDGLKVTYKWIECELRKAGRIAPVLAYAAD